MALVKLINYEEANEKVKNIFDDIMETRKSNYVNNIWRALANSPHVLEGFWRKVKNIMIKPTKIDSLSKEMIYIAVSVTNNCEYCINSHTFSARKKGMSDEILMELNEIIALANEGNKLANGLQVEVDEVFKTKNVSQSWVKV